MHILQSLFSILQHIKGYDVSLSNPKTNRMLLEKEGDGVYLVKVEKLGEGSIEDYASFL
jgi:hypothetical protein